MQALLEATNGELPDAEVLLTKQLEYEERAKKELLWKRGGKKKAKMVEEMEDQVPPVASSAVRLLRPIPSSRL